MNNKLSEIIIHLLVKILIKIAKWFRRWIIRQKCRIIAFKYWLKDIPNKIERVRLKHEALKWTRSADKNLDFDKDPLHPSLDIDPLALMEMNKKESLEYRSTILRRRAIAAKKEREEYERKHKLAIKPL